MVKYILSLAAGLLCGVAVEAQELFVFTEPASNMAAHSLGLRLNNTLYRMEGSPGYAYRLEPELMWGAGKNLMIHAAVYTSDMYQPSFKAEGGSLYAKYRIYANDDVHRHFRLAAFSKAALVDNPGVLQTTVQGERHTYESDEIDLNGNNSGFLAGMVATQLIHKLALSGSMAYAQRWNNGSDAHGVPGQSGEALDYSASAGVLLFPRHYKDYRQTNMNLMCEFLGASSLDKAASFVDVAPAVQFIFNSISRLDLGYRTQVAGDMSRLGRSSFFVRLEYNFLNVYR